MYIRLEEDGVSKTEAPVTSSTNHPKANADDDMTKKQESKINHSTKSEQLADVTVIGAKEIVGETEGAAQNNGHRAAVVASSHTTLYAIPRGLWLNAVNIKAGRNQVPTLRLPLLIWICTSSRNGRRFYRCDSKRGRSEHLGDYQREMRPRLC